ncbi:tetratricopeptide repeat protein [Leptolyngbya sp. FACHB-261]|uniref:O-linked N-acetylglucosamine transferase family protein n=1 Tax=Leptolyngbya sp. FACHB-261 TaxID=2692806 RepID=UPI001685EAAC|nr:tetratricopeptide repeat protein [Leptolyngbya sp. FACHB-261]MBD2103008.1 tetratricopeptide repeat protein [Leptolyngbya sp. FACHB-261]
MDLQSFIEKLPGLYNNWKQTSIHPKSEVFQQLLTQVSGTTSVNALQLLNSAVGCLEPGEIYCEIGCLQGASLIGALLNHPNCMGYAVDNFSQFDALDENLDKLTDNLATFDLEAQVLLCQQDFEEFFADLHSISLEEKIGVYFYDGAHDYRSQLLGLLLVEPFLADQSLIALGGGHWESVQQVGWDFVAAHSHCKILPELSGWNNFLVLSWDKDQKHHYKWLELQKNHRPALIRSLIDLRAEQEQQTIDDLHRMAIKLHEQSHWVEAEQTYRQILSRCNNHADAWLNLGSLYYTTERYQEALTSLFKSLSLEPKNALLHYNFGLVLEKLGEFLQATEAYRQAIGLAPRLVDAYNNLGNLFLKVGRAEQAEIVYQQAVLANPEHYGSHLNLGNLLLSRGNYDAAIATYEKALELEPQKEDARHNLQVAFAAKENPVQACRHSAYNFFCQGNYVEAICQYQKLLELGEKDAKLYIALCACLVGLGREEEALDILREGIRLYPKERSLHTNLLVTLQEAGRTQEAIEAAVDASRLLPKDQFLELQQQLILPVLNDTPGEVLVYRQRFTEGLKRLSETTLDNSEDRENALEFLGSHHNFYLQYQGCDDLELQRLYGNFVQQVMMAQYPDWAQSRTLPSLKHGRIRIGYISPFFSQHSVARTTIGWLSHANKQDFEVFTYHVGRKADAMTQQFRLHSDHFQHIPDDLKSACEQIVADQLDILVFADIGMSPQMVQMSALRLAPIQCTTWGHPITSGSSAVDYFLSSDLMEPDNAQDHYSERLITLPNVSVAYPKPSLPRQTKKRSDFGLRDDTVLYLSCQSLFKYLPQYDFVFAEIARRVPQAQFAFLGSPKARVTQQFQRRLQRAFANISLKSEDYCVILPQQNDWHDFLRLNLVADIFLDTFSWSGFNTAMEAVACGLPIVTCPGQFMRGRHSFAVLKMLGITETVAKDESEYIEIAVKLALEEKWRCELRQRINNSHDRLYEDKVCVAALEDFYRAVVRQVSTERRVEQAL